MVISEGGPQTDETSMTQDLQCQHQRANTCVKGGSEAYEQGLPARAAGCQVISLALPSWYARWAEQCASGRLDIILFFDLNHQFDYYQRYQDIVVTFLMVVDKKLATSLVEKLSAYYLRDLMDPTMDNTKHILNYPVSIIDQVKKELRDYMQSAELWTIFTLIWLIP